MRRLLTILLIVAVVGAASLAPAVTHRYVATDGNDANGGTNFDDAWLTLAKAANTVAADTHIWIKAGTYSTEDVTGGATGAVFQIDTAGGATTPIIWEGYNATTGTFGGDGTFECVVISAGPNALTSAVNTSVVGAQHNVFKNMSFILASSHGANLGTNDDAFFDSCYFGNNSGSGLVADDRIVIFNCVAELNGAEGFGIDSFNLIVNSIAKNNTSYGVSPRVSWLSNCLFFDNGTANFLGGSASGTQTGVFNCTFDGGGAAIGASGAAAYSVLVNNVFYDCTVGIVGASGSENTVASKNNLFFSNDTDRTNWPSDASDIAADPLFVDAANNDYRLKGSSPALIAGADAALIDGITSRSYSHIGAMAPAWLPSIHADGGQLITLTATVTTVGIPANSLYLQLDPTNDHGTSNTSSAAGATATTALVATGTVGGAVESHLVPWSIKSHSDVGTWTLDSVSVNVAGTVRTLDLTNYTWEGSGGGTTVIVIDD